MARKLIVEVIGDSRSLERAFARSSKATNSFGRDIGRASRGALSVSGLFDGLGRSVAFASGAFLGGAGLVAVTKDAIGAASNLAEQQNKVNVVFGDSGKTITEWAKTTATSLGIANDQALEAAGTFGNLFTTIRIGREQNAQMSKSLIQLAADLASFNNASPEDVLDAIRSGLIGEAEPLRRFGVLLTEARVSQEAMRESGVKNVKNLTQQQKVLARYALILKDTKVAQGDFGRTADGLANASRSLSAEIRDTEASIGTALLPTVRKITIALRDWLGDEENQKKIQAEVERGIRVTTAAFELMIPVLERVVDLLDKTASGFDKLNNFLPFGLKTSDFAKIPGLNELKEVQKILGVLGVTGGDVRGDDEISGGLRRGALSDILEGRREQTAKDAATTKAIVKETSNRLSLIAKMSRAELAVARALSTKTKSDDRAALVAQANVVKEAIASHKKAFRDKAALYRQLASIQGEIQSIDEAARQKQIDAQEKAADAAKRARDKERAARKKAHDIAVRAAKEARDAAKQTAREFRDLIQTERDRIGELFSGPVFNPTEAQRQRALGFRDPAANARTLVADLKAQIQQFKDFERDLQKLAKRGAPPQLLQELRQQGLAVAPQVHALATAGAGTFAQFKSLFIQRERLAVQAAKQARPVVNLTVIVNKDTGHVQVKTTPHGQPRGRSPGVVINQGAVIN